jgi:hypothetical protein
VKLIKRNTIKAVFTINYKLHNAYYVVKRLRLFQGETAETENKRKKRSLFERFP